MKQSMSLVAVAIGAAAVVQVRAAPPPLEKAWHFADIGWKLPFDTPIELKSLSMDFTISGDIPADVNLYVSPLGRIGFDKEHFFYAGLQSSKPDDRGINCMNNATQRRGIFSRWGDRDLTAVRPAKSDGVTCESDSEGKFVSVRRPIAWQPGAYTISVARTGKPKAGQMWLSATVLNKQTGKATAIGSLRVPDMPMQACVISFLEVFAGGRAPATGLPIKVTFGNIRLNGTAIAPRYAVTGFYEKDGVPPVAEVTAIRPGEVELDVSRLRDRSLLPFADGQHYQLFSWSKQAGECLPR